MANSWQIMVNHGELMANHGESWQMGESWSIMRSLVRAFSEIPADIEKNDGKRDTEMM